MVKFKFHAHFPVDHLAHLVMSSLVLLLCQFAALSYYHYYYYYSLIRAFHINVSRWFFTGVWVTASLLKSPGLFLVFWLFSTMLSFGWSPLRQFPSPLVPLSILFKRTNYNWYNCHLHVPQFFQFPSKVEELIPLFTFFQFYSVVSRDSKVDYFARCLFLFIIKSGLLVGIRWSVCMLKSHRSLCVVHIPFVSMDEFKFLTHFPMNPLADPVVSRLILPLC